jgi:formiminoglutamase
LQRKTINAINFDAHSDFRILEGRHSGNGFSYAYEEGFLKNIVFGLHENYTSKSVLDIIKKQKIACDTPPMTVLKFVKKKDFNLEMFNALEFIKNDCFGIEIDLDAIPIASSAMTLSGFSVEELRQFITFFWSTQKMQPICIFAKALRFREDKTII